ncbi:MAG: M48 family metallopeptidase [Oscillatoriales cyanobacterium RM1_1_9]|nr:M48 family metallopeptidase [Oscillatoriales cyanobacterium SM2_3_0]NJO44918.1 M48 family metallopeptidase [Oscillatoriales cyanobacterium RM2_1_1]NJO70768.1 M48 family metallopeptidase [Oscillatoriales cyanobacterium RM1_1_9]
MSQEEFSSRNAPASNRQLIILLGIFATLIITLIVVPLVLVDIFIGKLPVSVEQQLGRLVVPVYQQMAKPSDTQTTLNQLLDQLETQLPLDSSQNRDYQIFYIPQDTVNAVAIPGDRILIFQGLLEEVESENELMMILGHELGHFAHRDHLRGIGRGLVLQAVLSMILPNVGSLESAALAVSNAQFSQSQERRADEFGLTLLNAHYGQVAGATDFFERLSRERQMDFAFLNTHPSSKDRVESLQELIQGRNYETGTRLPLPESLQNPAHLK